MLFFNRRVNVAESGVLNGITEMHCHILPAVDDGVKTAEESLKLLQMLEAQGVKELWFTPHIMEEVPYTPEALSQRFDEFKAIYKGNIKLNLAAEHMLDGLFRERISEKRLMPHAEGCLLVETSYSNPPLGLEEMLDEILSAGYYPLLAHPERYRYMEWEGYKKLKDKGIRFQLNLPSLVGAYGFDALKKAEKMLSEGMYDCFGTDLHSLRHLQYLLDSKMLKKHIKMLDALK